MFPFWLESQLAALPHLITLFLCVIGVLTQRMTVHC